MYPKETFRFVRYKRRMNSIYLKKTQGAFKNRPYIKIPQIPLPLLPILMVILFFSPSALKAFLARNNFRRICTTFLYRYQTTAARSRKHLPKILFIAQKPTIRNVLERVYRTFKTKTN